MAGDGVSASMLTQSFANGDQTFEGEAIQEHMKDTAFSVYSDPKFLYVIGKMCAKSKLLMYADLAIQSFHDYYLIVTYFKAQIPQTQFDIIKFKTFIWLSRIFLNVNQFE